MSEDNNCEKTAEETGRTIKIDTGYYKVEVYGEPGDDFQTVQKYAKEEAERAKSHVEDLESQIEADEDIHYR